MAAEAPPGALATRLTEPPVPPTRVPVGDRAAPEEASIVVPAAMVTEPVDCRLTEPPLMKAAGVVVTESSAPLDHRPLTSIAAPPTRPVEADPSASVNTTWLLPGLVMKLSAVTVPPWAMMLAAMLIVAPFSVSEPPGERGERRGDVDVAGGGQAEAAEAKAAQVAGGKPGGIGETGGNCIAERQGGRRGQGVADLDVGVVAAFEAADVVGPEQDLARQGDLSLAESVGVDGAGRPGCDLTGTIVDLGLHRPVEQHGGGGQDQATAVLSVGVGALEADLGAAV